MLLWKLHTLDYRIASVRYRALLPIHSLSRLGYRSTICKALGTDQLSGIEAVVFVKSLSLKDLLFAQRVNEAGIPIVLDLCDNIFVPNYAAKSSVSPAEVIQVMARYVAVITTTGPALAAVLQKNLDVPVPIMTVSDGVEQEGASHSGRWMLTRAQRKELRRMVISVGFWSRVFPKLRGDMLDRARRWWYQHVSPCFWIASSSRGREKSSGVVPRSVQSQRREDSMKTLIWFGHAGGEYGRFGLPDLVDVAPSLEQLARRIKFKLLVVSNNREAYQALVQPLPFETQYVEWDSELIRGLIKASDVTIIPNSKDPFAICKSANRAVLSLSLGVPVVASRTPAMEVLEDCVIFDDWAEGLYRYLTDQALVRQHLETAQRVVEREFGQDRIAHQWEKVLRQILVTPRPVKSRISTEQVQTVAVIIHLAQDFDLALGVLTEAVRWRGIRFQAWVSLSLLESSPRVWRGLRAHGIEFRILDDQTDVDLKDFRGIGGVVTIAETNQSPHRFPHRIASLANKKGVLTYTIQHGFENIGLTYSDKRYPIERIVFASKVIFTWGPLNLLHPDVPNETREKCIPVGCCKDVPTGRIRLPLPVSRRLVVGIFENLHWERYDRRYAERFVQDAQSLAERFPGIVFLVKPHHTGRWLTSRYEGTVLSVSNLVIADPAHPDWEQFTASQLVNSLDGVITTPSTVAVDAARAGKPVAVVGYELDVSAYSPLCILTEREDWVSFVDGLRNPVLVQRSADFVAQAVCSGHASASMVCKIVEDMGIKAAHIGETEIAAEEAVDRLQKVV